MRCECGCGLGFAEDAEDEVTQALIEEACFIALDALEADDGDDTPEKKPGEITDPAVLDAMEKAKQLHAETHGIHV